MTPEPPQGLPSPALFLDAACAYRRCAALRTGLELDVFTALDGEPLDAGTLATRCGASPRGMRILCDALATLGALDKMGERYALTSNAAIFLSRKSPMCMAAGFLFLSSAEFENPFQQLTAAVRQGGTPLEAQGVVAPENEFWIEFARSMGPMMAFPADSIAQLLGADRGQPWNVLDVAAGHGAFGIAIARQNPRACITALDWPAVLEVARWNAEAAGLGDRYRTLPGNAFEVHLGTGYDVVLLTNILHHFDPPTCETLLRRVHAALSPGGRVAALEFVPGVDRVTPPFAAMFALNMLVHTPAGDAYTFPELERMFRNTGFGPCELHPLPPGPQSVVITSK
jgi:hypothetical protein